MDKPIETKTLVHIYITEQGTVEADFNFRNMSYDHALRVNLRLDQCKAEVLKGFQEEIAPILDDKDIEDLLK